MSAIVRGVVQAFGNAKHVPLVKPLQLRSIRTANINYYVKVIQFFDNMAVSAFKAAGIRFVISSCPTGDPRTRNCGQPIGVACSLRDSRTNTINTATTATLPSLQEWSDAHCARRSASWPSAEANPS